MYRSKHTSKIDRMDSKILSALESNSRQSFGQIAKKAKTSKEVINYHVKNLVEKKIINRFFAEINLAKLGMQVYKIYLQFQNVTDEKEKEMYKYFTEELKIPWVVSCSGRYDMIISFGAKDINEFNNYLTKILNKFSSFILNREISTTIYFDTYNRKWLTEEKQATYTRVGGEIKNLQLDKIDASILAQLSNNARIPIIDLAKKTKMTSSAIIYRLKRLESDGIINAYRVGIDYRKFGKEFCKCFVYLRDKTTEKERKLLAYVAQLPEIFTIIKCVGSWDLEFEFIVNDFTQFNTIMRDLRNKFDIIRGYESVIIVEEYGINYFNFL